MTVSHGGIWGCANGMYNPLLAGFMTYIAIEGEAARDLDGSIGREWLVVNGIGGYASGTVSGINTRRYHGLLMAAIRPPVQRMALLVRLDATLYAGDATYELATAEYTDGTIFPSGYRLLESFVLEDGVPTWHYVAGPYVLKVSVWMVPGRNITVVRYKLVAGGDSVELSLRPLTAARDHHSLQRGNREYVPGVDVVEDGVLVRSEPPLWLIARGASFHPAGDWYWNYLVREERARGYDSTEDLFQPGTFRTVLQPGGSLTLIASAQDPAEGFPDLDGALVTRRNLAAHLAASASPSAHLFDHRLTELKLALREAAEAFVVQRHTGTLDSREACSVIAGYHWFTDWGRDAMICLPGLLLVTGHAERAAGLLRTFAQAIDQGMIPNRFPDTGEQIEYNTADATMWFFQAIQQTLAALPDVESQALLRDLYPELVGVIDWHLRGTRYGIGVDPQDGLLFAGVAGTDGTLPTQLTWMDARTEHQVITPRIGKPVEINALWIDALTLMAQWALTMGEDPAPYRGAALQARGSFASRFWYAEGGYLFDVIDGPNGDDSSLRPNQLIALGRQTALLPDSQAASALQAVTDALLTPYGLRTLAPSDSHYGGRCAGNQATRDLAYHQGTVWPWLLGPYVDSYMRLYPVDQDFLAALLLPFSDHLLDAGLGSISEIFDGDAPHLARGCIAQAWSVAELLRIAQLLT